MFKKAALFVLLFPIGLGLVIYAGRRVASSLESARDFGALTTREVQRFLKTYNLIARLGIANLGMPPGSKIQNRGQTAVGNT